MVNFDEYFDGALSIGMPLPEGCNFLNAVCDLKSYTHDFENVINVMRTK